MRGDGITRWIGDTRLLLCARVTLVSAFLVSGVSKALDFDAAVGEVRALSGLEPAVPLALFVIAVQLGGAALVIVGGRLAWFGAALLALFTLVATVAGHAFWTRTGAAQIRDLTTFFEHVGLVTGLFLGVISMPRVDGGS